MLIITGLAGAGKTIALDTLEDLGYYCIDNLPSALLDSLVRDFAGKQPQPVAVAMDSRNAADLAALPEKIRHLRTLADIQILFLTADTDILVRRYSETRRPHPLHIHAENPRALPEAIEYERHLLNPLMNLADIILDTSHYSVYQLKDRLRTVLGDAAPSLIITLQSFGFKHGTPVNADFLFDVRFLPNPYWDPAIRAYSGSDAPIIEFLERYDEPRRFVADTVAYLKNWLPAFVQGSNRAYLTIGIGCTGGQHRSVYVTEKIGALLKPDFPGLHIEHRDRKAYAAGHGE